MTCRISFRNWTWTQDGDTFTITLTTDVPCHCYMRWSLVEPQKHIVPILRRGIPFSSELYFCFTVYDDNEQEEAGDTLTHTFIKPNWTYCQTRWFYFWGSISGEVCVSTSVPVSLHNTVSAPPPPVYPTGQPLPTLLYAIINNASTWACLIGGLHGVNIAWPTYAVYPISTEGALKYFYVKISPEVPVGESITITLYLNGVATDISVTLTEGQSEGSDLLHSVDVAPGDKVSYRNTEGFLGYTTIVRPTIMFSNYLEDETLILGGKITGNDPPFTVYLPFSGATISSSEDRAMCHVPFDGTIKNFFGHLSSNPGNTWTFTLRKNAVDTALTFSIPSTTNEGHDDTHTVSVITGDILTIRMSAIGSGARIPHIGFTLIPSVSDIYPLTSRITTAPSTSQVTYIPIFIDTYSASTDRNTREQILNPCVLSQLRVWTTNAPGAGKSYAFVVLKNGVETPLLCQIANLAKYGEDLDNEVTVDPFDLMCIRITPAGNPASTGVLNWSFTAKPYP